MAMFGWNAIQTPPSHNGNVGGEVLPDEFGTEPLRGYRGWHVVNAEPGPGWALKSLHVSYLWGRQVEAFCHKQGMMFQPRAHIGSVSPDPACSCGIYAQLPEHPLDEWDRAKLGRVSASGTIAMWGRIIQCERGYKAQYASIQDPIVIDLSCLKDCDRDPIVVAIPHHPQLVFNCYCDEHARSADGHVTVPADIWLREVSERLSQRYDIEVLTWA